MFERIFWHSKKLPITVPTSQYPLPIPLSSEARNQLPFSWDSHGIPPFPTEFQFPRPPLSCRGSWDSLWWPMPSRQRGLIDWLPRRCAIHLTAAAAAVRQRPPMRQSARCDRQKASHTLFGFWCTGCAECSDVSWCFCFFFSTEIVRGISFCFNPWWFHRGFIRFADVEILWWSFLRVYFIACNTTMHRWNRAVWLQDYTDLVTGPRIVARWVRCALPRQQRNRRRRRRRMLSENVACRTILLPA